ncbi:hypothetical protein, partial [Escherichia coli]|uniref:hypothetical protein n=1 Tax=Escherichia coli TaxID=562 RepID=UPI001BFE71D8
FVLCAYYHFFDYLYLEIKACVYPVDFFLNHYHFEVLGRVDLFDFFDYDSFFALVYDEFF